MNIISIKRSYECDHSSTTYRFFTSEGRISQNIRDFLKEKNSKFEIRGNSIKFHFPGERYLSDTIEDTLLKDHNISIMIQEDYDWWNIYD